MHLLSVARCSHAHGAVCVVGSLDVGIPVLVWKCAGTKRSDTFRDERGMDPGMSRVMVRGSCFVVRGSRLCSGFRIRRARFQIPGSGSACCDPRNAERRTPNRPNPEPRTPNPEPRTPVTPSLLRLAPTLHRPDSVSVELSGTRGVSMRLGCVCAFVLQFVLLITPAAALAQFDSATVVGTVRDASGGSVPAAKVTLTGVETGHLRRQDVDRDRRLRVSRGPAGRLRRDRREDGIRARPGRQRHGPGRRAPAGGFDDAGGAGHREGRGHGIVAAARNRFESARPGHQRRPDARAAAPLARVLVTGAPDDRRQAGRFVAHDREYAARGRLERQRPAQHLQQLPDRRRRQQRLRHQQPGILQPGDAAVAGRDRRVQGRHQQHERRVRARGRARRST